MAQHLLLPLRSALTAVMLLASCGVAQAADTPLPVIGILSLESPGRHREVDAFLEGLRERGYVEGRNVAIEYRWGEYDETRLPALAAELVARKLAVLVALAPPALRAAKAATSTVPIVMRTTIDPVREGFVQSLARPGGNITGVSSYSGSLYGKRLELLKELVPGLARVAVLGSPSSLTYKQYAEDVARAAQALGIAVVPVEARTPDELPAAFDAAARAGASALLPLRDPLVVGARARIAALAREHKLPAIYDDREFVEAGGLMSYGANLNALHRRAAYYVERILKGAAPAELPVEEPTVFETLVNAGAARAIGLAIPPAILMRADEVVE